MPQPRLPVPPKNCLYCGKPLERKVYNGRLEDRSVFMKRQFCDLRCWADAKIAQGTVTVERSRRRARTFRGDACAQCGATENLDTHHLDLNPYNNAPENLMTLCDVCHAKWHWAHGKRTQWRRTSCEICGRPADKHRMCQKHWIRLQKYGDPLLTKKRTGYRTFEVVRVGPND